MMDDVVRSEIIEMALSDDVPFDAIHHRFGLDEPAAKRLMQSSIKPASYRAWRKRVRSARDRYARYK